MFSKDHVYSLKELSLIIDWTCNELFWEFFFWCRAEIGSLKQYWERTYVDLVQVSKEWKIVEKTTWIVRNKKLITAFLHHTQQSIDELVWQEVLVQCTIKWSLKYGFSCTIHSFSKEFTKGKQEISKDTIRKNLQKAGIYERNKKTTIGPLPYTIALISSKQAAGLKDFQAVVEDSWWNIKTALFESRVHGNEAAVDVVSALKSIQLQREWWAVFSSVCIVRWWWGKEWFARQNDEKLLSVVCNFPIPVCVAVWHTEDLSILDEVVSQSAKTPTDAAYYYIQQYESTATSLTALRSWVKKDFLIKKASLKEKIPYMYQSINTRIASKFITYRQSTESWYRSICSYTPERLLKNWYFIIQNEQWEYQSSQTINDAPAWTRFRLLSDKWERQIRVE